jgi:hypothetical protein
MSEPYGILTMSQFEEIYKVVANKDAEIARLRLTDEERIAIATAIVYLQEDDDYPGIAKDKATLRLLLARLAVK